MLVKASDTTISVDLSTPVKIYTVNEMSVSKTWEEDTYWTATVGWDFKRYVQAYSSSSWSVYLRVRVNWVQVASQYVSTWGSSSYVINFSCNKWDIVVFRLYAWNSNWWSCNSSYISLSSIKIWKKWLPWKPTKIEEIWDLWGIFIFWKIWEDAVFNIMSGELSRSFITWDITLWEAVWFITIYNPTDDSYYKIPVYK